MDGQVVVVTGGGSGIGQAVAVQCAARRATVVVLDRDEQAGEGTVSRIRAFGGMALAIRCDVADEASVVATFQRLQAEAGVPTGLFAAAGTDIGGFVHELAAERWDAVLRTNLGGTFLVAREALRTMVASGTAGSIVLCSSPAAFVGFGAGGAGAYAASKGGVSALTRSLAVDYARYGIRVNAVVPGATETPLMWANVAEERRASMRKVVEGEVPLGRLASPDEPARAVVWLLSSDSSYVTGSHLVCDGGVLAKASISV
jgi:NAD(P)-dependent dehydrogenase (short-subunit alcohol dehydrogenase family)